MSRAGFSLLFVAGLLLLPFSTASAQANEFECSAMQTAIIEQQKYSADWLIGEVLAGLKAGRFKSEMHQWFGTHSVAFRTELVTRFGFAQYYVREIIPKCLKPNHANYFNFAFVEPKNPKIQVYFGKPFFDSPELFVCQRKSPNRSSCEEFKLRNDGELKLSKDTMMGTIIHEVLHFDRIWSNEPLYLQLQNPMVGVDDVEYINPDTGKRELLLDKNGRPIFRNGMPVYKKVYGQSKALETASLFPERARNNADNFQFFVEAALKSLLKPNSSDSLKPEHTHQSPM